MKCLNNFEILSTFDSVKYLNKIKLVQIKTFLFDLTNFAITLLN